MDKRVFRNIALKRLKRLSRGKALVYDTKIINYLKELIIQKQPKSVMVYIPMKLEVDINRLSKELRQKGIDVYVPFMEGESFRLVKYRLPFHKKRFGIYEPKFSRQYRRRYIDIAIVPIVGTDPTFRRIGFGKGMYDRFFEKNRRYIKDIIFIQRLFCYSIDILTQEHDISADMIITGKCVISNTQKNISYRHRKVLNSI